MLLRLASTCSAIHSSITPTADADLLFRRQETFCNFGSRQDQPADANARYAVRLGERGDADDVPPSAAANGSGPS